ncbi:ribonuclease P protein component [Deinococcus taeanensis]|uniref:ribonuclease P protein component n=1 Tax=Deinococcus taeanensis TaxID=2737050 RepID=UPI001CDCEFC7|nr:ribonuclease P protein component [Deinococcus taeanensis]UBV43302.1 ribonuclease P protein component [Deinococcus taeanensis]
MALDSLRGDREFRKVRAHGVAVRNPLFTLRVTEYRPRHGEPWRPRAIIGIVISKKTLRRAVDRNRARRRVREALRTLPGGLPTCRAILLPNPAVLTAPFPDLQAALQQALSRAPTRGGRGGGNPGRAARVPAAVPKPSPSPLDSQEPDPAEGGNA